jgi:hypothetical protein
MQKHKNTHQDTNKEEELITSPGERTIFFKANEDDIDFFWGEGNFQRDRNFQQNKQTGQLQQKGGMEDLE